MGNIQNNKTAVYCPPIFILWGVRKKMKKFNDSIQYIRIISIDEIDFDNLDTEYVHQLAKGIVNLVSTNDREDDQEAE